MVEGSCQDDVLPWSPTRAECAKARTARRHGVELAARPVIACQLRKRFAELALKHVSYS